jgi:hypothetical protein
MNQEALSGDAAAFRRRLPVDPRAMSPARRSGDGDLHGNAPDDGPIALLIIDAISDFDYEEADGVLAE